MTGLQLTPAQRLPVLLLAVTALWALIFAVAGFTGLAGRYRLHPDDPARVPEVPALDLSRARSPLQLVEAYAGIGERPLFNPDRRPLPPAIDPKDATADEDAAPDEASPLDIAVTSVILTPTMKLAIVTDNRSGKSQLVRVGEALEGEQSGWHLQELEPRKAVFAGPGGSSSVDLRVFDGAGGQAPAAAMAAGAAGQAPVAPTPTNPSLQPAAAAATAEQAKIEAMTPEQRSEMIRRRIEERRRQMREEAERINNSQDKNR